MLDLARSAQGKVGPKPKHNQSLGLTQKAGLLLIWIGLVKSPIWAARWTQQIRFVKN